MHIKYAHMAYLPSRKTCLIPPNFCQIYQSNIYTHIKYHKVLCLFKMLSKTVYDWALKSLNIKDVEICYINHRRKNKSSFIELSLISQLKIFYVPSLLLYTL